MQFPKTTFFSPYLPLVESFKYYVCSLLIVGMEKGYKAQTSIIEIGQYWWNMQGRKAVVAIQRVLGHYVDTFSYYSPMAIRNDNEAYQHIAYSPIYPKFKVTDILRRFTFLATRVYSMLYSMNL